MKRPVVALSLDWREKGCFSIYPWYALREHYCQAIHDAGGIPFLLPYHLDAVEEYLDIADALLITGGDFDIDPSMYGVSTIHDTVKVIPDRTRFEFDMTRKALERDIPVLGICGGHQLLNVALGGTLIQHIPDELETTIAHEQPNPRHEVGHSIKVHQGTMLHDIVGDKKIYVNSAHHQAIKTVSKDVTINAFAEDGVIEGIEAPAYKFCLGVQWHPEFQITKFDKCIFDAFIKAAK